MKKLLTVMFGLASLCFVGCMQDVAELEVPTLGLAPQIRIDGSINQEYVSRVDDGGFCTGDQIGLYGVNYTEENTIAGELLDKGNQVDNARYTFDAENWVWKSSGSIYYKDAETNIDLYGYYPYGTPESVRAYEFEVQRDQTGENTVDGYGLSDFLWGKAENIAPTEAKVKLRFNHILACANVVLTEGEGFLPGEFESLKKQVLLMNTTRKAVIDLQSGAVEATVEAESEGLVMKANDEGFRAVVVPQTLTAGTSLFTITLDGINYRFKNSTTDVTYKSGKQTNFTIKLKKKSHEGEYELALVSCEIVDWVADLDAHGGEARQYFVVKMEEAGTLEQTIRAANKNPDKIKNLKISGNICKADFEFMRNSMALLQAVNLKETKIVGSWRYHVHFDDGKGWRDEYFAGNMPESEQERQAMVRARAEKLGVEVTGWSSCNVYSYDDEIPFDAFCDKTYLTYFCFPEKVTKIGDNAFNGTLLSGALIIPNDVVEIGGGAFANTNITSLQLPHVLKILGGSAFSGCKSLASPLSLPESLESIGGSCFAKCGMLTGNVVLPHKLTSIPGSCFQDCKCLTGGLDIPEGVESIGSYAFNGCIGMRGSIKLPNSLKSIGSHAFYQSSFQGELVIPAQIKILTQCCFSNTNITSVVFKEGSELILLQGNNGDGEGWGGAFSNCHRICEPIVLPESVITIEGRSFYQCSMLPGIVIPKSVIVIGNEAFNGCTSLSAITCNAKTPPVCGNGAWNGVAKDNFTVEVPEQSVVKYQTQGGWNEFRRIAAHHDFSLSRSLLRVLNDAHTQTYVMRAPAGEAWSVESCPEWVTVTPSSGVGKVDVTVTVNEMAAADVAQFNVVSGGSVSSPSYSKHNGRAGEIVFLLNAKDYRTKMKVEQYDYAYGDGDVLVNQSATEGEGINIVFMGDCFDAKDIASGNYLAGVEQAISHYFAIEPYKSYRDYFNVYTVFGLSPDSGMGTVNTIKDAKFGSQYSLDGIAPNHATCYEYAMKAETVNESNLNKTLVVLVENTTDYGGICYMWGDGSAIACCPMSADAYPYDFRGIVQHEAGGHGFGKLADEYIYHNAFIQSCSCTCCGHLDEFRAGKQAGWYRNLSEDGNMKTVEWAHLIYHPDYSNIVDMYEGGYFHTRGIYRSESTSCMNNNIPYYSAISRQAMVERMMEYAGKQFDINDFYAKDVRDASNNTATRLQVMETAITMTGAGKQMPPKFMGDKPQLNKSNK